MKRRRRTSPSGIRCLGIGLLILGMAHTPLPQLDFHNVRHQDRPGEVCTYHDHLLRWHPDAGEGQDRPVLHWHWFLPGTDPEDPATGSEDGPALHAHLAGWELLLPDDAPQLRPGGSTRELVRPPAVTGLAAFLPVEPSPTASRPGDRSRPIAFGATAARAGSRAAGLQRWNC